MRLPARVRVAGPALAAALWLVAILGAGARAEWLQPDATFRDAQLELRAALRDTVGQSASPARLDTLGVALLRLGRYPDAQRVFLRALEIHPGDEAASAGLGKLALFQGRLAEAESLLAIGLACDPTVPFDLLAARVRRGEYAAAALLADSLGQSGRAEMLRRMADQPTYSISGNTEAKLSFARNYPVALVHVRLNGQYVLMALDTGAGDLVLDDVVAKQCKVELLPSQASAFWSGGRVALRNAMVNRIEIDGVRIDHVPAGVLGLRRWSIEVNPQGERIAGAIGLNLLRRFTPTLDYKNMRLELRPPGAALPAGPDVVRVPFEIWGENELTVYGNIAAGRRMAMVVQTGIPGCGVAAPGEVFEELGIKSGRLSRMVKGAGRVLQGRSWSAVSVPSVTVGPVLQGKLDGWSNALDFSELWRHGVRRDAALAGDFFRGSRVTVDWVKQELLFERE